MPDRPLLVHVAGVRLARDTGMGRIACHWLRAFVDRGWEVWHIGPEETSQPIHRTFWPGSAWECLRSSGRKPHCVLAHEPSADVFHRRGLPTVLFSHGIESRGAKLVPVSHSGGSVRSILLKPLWVLHRRAADRALRSCPLLLLSNNDDASHAKEHFGRKPSDIIVFRNGVDCIGPTTSRLNCGLPTVLFYGSWISRKGIDLLVKAAAEVHRGGTKAKWLLVGTGVQTSEVLACWPSELNAYVEAVPYVDPVRDSDFYGRSDVFVMPSYFEGQPLTLLQAMEHGLCPIASNTCGQKDVIEHGKSGFLFECGDWQALANLLTECLKSAEVRARTGVAARRTVAERSWDAVSLEVVRNIEDRFL